MTSDSQVRADLRKFFVENFFMGDESVVLSDTDSFMETGTVDSTGMLEVVMFLEQHFGLKVDDKELVPENLDSMANLVQFVGRKQSAAR
jgi:acyl carrier protein